MRALQRDAQPGTEPVVDADADAEGDAGSDATSDKGQAPPRRRRRRSLLVGGLLLIVAAVAVTLVVRQTASRLPGQTATGSVSLSPGAQLQRTLVQAETLQASGSATEALHLYDEVLAQDPTQPVALAQAGWLEYEAGAKSGDASVLSQAQTTEEAAVAAAPASYAPHLYLGSMFLAEADAGAALVQYRQFLADDPPAAEVRLAKPFITQAAQRSHQPVPAMSG
jgi:hypothetical protein